MKQLSLTCIFFLFISLSFVYGQHFIGNNKEEIKDMMQESDKELFFTKEVKTDNHHFLKYENMDNTKTMLFILDKDGKCQYTKLMCDYALLNSMQKKLNREYEYQKDLTWIDYAADQSYNYLIELEKKEWFFTIKTSRIKN